ncbi:aspartyl-phosphate phosphatase Spo0E family protein [Clostridium oceanicum]|uniref:Aspartyl-phosphate phosphatase Spo0E family protein n=1 Tax=Clostridium oceanicum TaxID=1543 RepID=A0ABP3UUT7_9CLOT
MGTLIEKTREKLNLLIEEDSILHEGEILKVSQELDSIIYKYYKKQVLL